MMSLSLLELPEVLAEVRRQAIALAHASWPELGSMLDEILPDPMEPFALLPICTGVACGAAVETLVPLAAIIVVGAYALRIVDDVADEDDPDALHLSIGAGRAINGALALSMAASHALLALPMAPDRKEILLNDYHQAFLTICEGQDQDMRGLADSLPDYCAVVQAKTVAAFEFAALAGARIATDNAAAIEKCRACGKALGWMIQILDDIEALWFPDGASDLGLGRLTFPVLYGLTMQHPATPTLQRLCSERVYDTYKIRSVLDQMGVRRYLVSHALDHRDAALAALASPLQPEGRALLQLWLDWLLRDAERLMGD